MLLSYQRQRRTHKRRIAGIRDKLLQGTKGLSVIPGQMITSGTIIPARLLQAPKEELSALALWAFTLGIFALLTFGLTAVPSIICGHVALARTRKDRGSSLARSVALAGLVIGYAGAAVLGAWLVLAIEYFAS